MKKKFLTCIMALTLGTMMFTGCASKAEGAAGAEAKGVKITIVGSTTVAEPMEELVALYKEEGCPDNIEVQGNGSSAGIKAGIDKTADIGMASRELSDEEKSAGLTETIIAHDGIAVVVNPKNTVSDLTTEQIKDIFEGKITNWSEVGGADQAIVVIAREAGSGTRGAFEEIVGLIGEDKGSTIVQTALVSEGTGAVMGSVATKDASIGFVSEGYLDDTVKAVSIGGVECKVENVKDKTYPIARPLILVTQPDVKQEAQNVIDFILSDKGQEVISEKYITVK